MVPTVLVELILAAGVVKLGWFKALTIVIVNRRTTRSRIFISFKSPKSRLRMGGPESMLKPELPNLPMGQQACASMFPEMVSAECVVLANQGVFS